MIFGNQKINTNPCTEAEQKANWSVVNNKFVQIDQVIEAGGLPDHKVAISAFDEGGAGADYLFAKIQDAGSFNSDTDAIVSAADAGAVVAFFWSATNVVGYSPTGLLNLIVDNGVLQFAGFTDTVDNYTVKVTTSDLTASFLHDAFNLNATYSSPADLLIATETVGAGGTNQKERPFVDVSIINGYDATAFRVWTIENNTTLLASITVIGQKLVLDATFIAFLDANYAAIGGGDGGTAKFGRADSDIDPRTGTTAKSGTVSICTFDDDGNITDTGDNETWWNLSGTGKVRAGDYIQSKMNATNGKMMVDFEDCTLSDL